MGCHWAPSWAVMRKGAGRQHPWEGCAGICCRWPEEAQMMLFYSGILAAAAGETSTSLTEQCPAPSCLLRSTHRATKRQAREGEKDRIDQLQTSTANLGNLYTPARAAPVILLIKAKARSAFLRSAQVWMSSREKRAEEDVGERERKRERGGGREGRRGEKRKIQIRKK